MKLYEVSTDAMEDGKWSRSWEGTWTDAKAKRKTVCDSFSARWGYACNYDIKLVDVPTHKVGLLEFLNENCKEFP